MNFLNKLEKKLGRFAIPNLALYLIICYAFGYVITLANPQFVHWISLNPFYIMQGQIWRIISWVLIPPSSSNVLFVAIMCLFYFSIGRSLEQTWGTFYFNAYIFGGIFITVIAAFIMAGVMCIGVNFDALSTPQMSSFFGVDNGNGMAILAYFYEEIYPIFRVSFSTYYINMSMFLAYAMTYPDMQVLLMFIIPIKVKWLGVAYGVMLTYEIVMALIQGGWYIAVAIVASLLNFGIFFLLTMRNRPHRTAKQARAARDFKRATSQTQNAHMNYGGQSSYRAYADQTRRASDVNAAPKPKVTRHRCAICGLTELDDPQLEFRFCSKCEGNYEYCQVHLFSHTHVHRQ